MRVCFKEIISGLLRKLDTNTLLIQTNTQLLADVVGRETKHFSWMHKQMVLKQIIENYLMGGTKISYSILLSPWV